MCRAIVNECDVTVMQWRPQTDGRTDGHSFSERQAFNGPIGRRRAKIDTIGVFDTVYIDVGA